MNISYLLNEKLEICDEHDAKFESCKKRENTTHGVKHSQILREFATKVTSLAEAASQKTKPNPIGGPQSPEIEMEGYKFHWEETSQVWECQRKTCTLRLNPSTDQEDTKTFLKSLRPIEEKILNRGIATRESIQIHIGTPQWPGKEEKPSVAAASSYMGKKIEIFCCQNNSHLLTTKIQETSQISVSLVILHEISHLLEPFLEENLRDIITSFEDFPKIKETLHEISPNYLGAATDDIAKNIQTLLKAKTEGKPVKTPGGVIDATTYLNYWREKVCHEIFAETIRHFYLEPALTGQISEEPKTGWRAFDDLTHRLIKEAKHNQKTQDIQTPPFPEKRAKRKFPLFEKIDEILP